MEEIKPGEKSIELIYLLNDKDGVFYGLQAQKEVHVSKEYKEVFPSLAIWYNDGHRVYRLYLRWTP